MKMIKKETGRDACRLKIFFELGLDVAGKWKFHGTTTESDGDIRDSKAALSSGRIRHAF